MTLHRITTLIAVLAWAAIAVVAPASFQRAWAADTTGTPEAEFVQKMGDKAIVQLTDKAQPRAAREVRARQILHDHFDVPTIARFAMGPAWRDATDPEKKEYMGLFEDMIVQTYTTRFQDYSGQSFKVTGARDEDERNFIVSSQIVQKGGPPVDVEWHVRKKDGGMKVIDVIVENISMGQTQRDDFASVIQGGGGKVSALIDSLRERGKKAAKK